MKHIEVSLNTLKLLESLGDTSTEGALKSYGAQCFWATPDQKAIIVYDKYADNFRVELVSQ